jgi:2-oxo-3-hexenedioate decarboxylase
MALAAETVAELAAFLDKAEMERREVTKITDRYPEMDWDDAYAIQRGASARASRRAGSPWRGTRPG